jgi:uncharacterized protein
MQPLWRDHFQFLGSCFTLSLVLAGCAGNPPPPQEEPVLVEGPDEVIELEAEGFLEREALAVDRTLDDLLLLARNLPTPQSEQNFLLAARYLADNNRQRDAAALLDTIRTDLLPLALAAEFALVRASLYMHEDLASEALQALANPRFTPVWPQLSAELRLQAALIRADAYQASGEYLNSARERIGLTSMLPPESHQDQHEKIWAALMGLPVNQLSELARAAMSFDFQGWFELAMIGKVHQNNLDRELAELERWQNIYARHPAASSLPQAMRWVRILAAERPKRVALLLPLQTPAGAVVRDSFMAAYFNNVAIGGTVPEVSFYDTTNTNNILGLYEEARGNGAEMIIGPLQKQHVQTLLETPNLPIPVLALNNVEGMSPRSPVLYQFALSPEDESRQVARRAWQDGHRNAAILSPLDSTGDDFYLRKRQSFVNEWQQLGGRVVTQEMFRDDYTAVIRNLLDISRSEFRREELSRLLGQPLAFTQRRRQDIDFIFLMAPPIAARQIKPSLAYLFAGDIPVYATQDIYDGIPSPQQDQDLNGVMFSESPWLLSATDDELRDLQTLFPQNNGLYLRLQAFGVDAFRLYPRLRQLAQEGESNVIVGASGLLKVGAYNNIVREMTWARMQNGIAVPL